MFCANCGEKLDEGTRFCTKCGTAVDSSAVQPTGASAQQPSSASQTGAYQQTAPTANKNPLQYFTGAFKKYAVFSGRARRAEFWWFTLFYWIISIATSLIDTYTFSMPLFYLGDSPMGVFNTLYTVAAFLPALAVTWRRMHDCDKAGLCLIIPIYDLVLACTEGTTGDNRFGSDPKQGN